MFVCVAGAREKPICYGQIIDLEAALKCVLTLKENTYNKSIQGQITEQTRAKWKSTIVYYQQLRLDGLMNRWIINKAKVHVNVLKLCFKQQAKFSYEWVIYAILLILISDFISFKEPLFS